MIFSKQLASIAFVGMTVLTLQGCGATTPTTNTPMPSNDQASSTDQTGSGDTTNANATTTYPITNIQAVNACEVFKLSDLTTVFSGPTPVTTSDGTPKPGFSGNTYSNCHWSLSKDSFFELHVESFPDHAGASGIVTSNLADDRVQGAGRFEYTMEPSLGPEAYFRRDAKSSKLSIVVGSTFYDLLLSGSGNLDSNAATTALKRLAALIH